MLKHLRSARGSAAALAALLLGAGAASAQVPICDALTLYGNAANSGLCTSLSPTTQNLWVCAMTTGVTDVHTTFNAATAFHITVRINPAPPNCEGNSYLTGNWPGGLARQAGQPLMVCGVNIDNYVARLNAVPQVPPGGTTNCRAGFIAAGAAGRISQATMQSYLNTCAAQACP